MENQKSPTTTIMVDAHVREWLESMKLHPRESNNSVLQRVSSTISKLDSGGFP